MSHMESWIASSTSSPLSSCLLLHTPSGRAGLCPDTSSRELKVTHGCSGTDEWLCPRASWRPTVAPSLFYPLYNRMRVPEQWAQTPHLPTLLLLSLLFFQCDTNLWFCCWGPQERQVDALPPHWSNHSALALGACMCVCVCAARTLPVRQPGWYFFAGSAESWPSQHHGGVNQWNPIRHRGRWERNWAAKKAQTETIVILETFLWKYQRVNKTSLPRWHMRGCSPLCLKQVQSLVLKTTHLNTALLTIYGSFKSTVWDMLERFGLYESHLCITKLHFSQIELWYNAT